MSVSENSETKITKEELLKESATLHDCPFCGGKAEFVTNKSNQIIIQHLPAAGVVCPARYEQYTDSYEIGRLWWNTRLGRIHYEVIAK